MENLDPPLWLTVILFLMLISFMPHVELKERPCRPVEFMGQVPHIHIYRRQIDGYFTSTPFDAVDTLSHYSRTLLGPWTCSTIVDRNPRAQAKCWWSQRRWSPFVWPRVEKTSLHRLYQQAMFQPEAAASCTRRIIGKRGRIKSCILSWRNKKIQRLHADYDSL